MLFVDGGAQPCVGETAVFAQRCCASATIAVTPEDLQSAATMELLVQLINRGVLQIAQDH
jgi:hypothetical protein